MITKPHTRPFKYPVLQEYAALGLDPTKIEGLYLFDPAGNLYDASGNERHGSLDFTAFKGGRYGPGGEFDGTNDISVLANSAGLSFGDGATDTSFSVSLYLNIDPTAATSVLVAKQGAAGTREWRLQIAPLVTTYEASLRLTDDSADKVASITSSAGFDLTPGKFEHLVVTYNPALGSGATAANGMSLYVNGKLDTNPTRSNDAAYVAMEPLAASITIGALANLALDYKGFIDNVMIYSDALDASQISNMCNAGL